VAQTGHESYPVAGYDISSDKPSGSAIIIVLVWERRFRSTQFPINNTKSNSLLGHQLAEEKLSLTENQHMVHFRAVPYDITSDSIHANPPTMLNRSLRGDTAVTLLPA
jgi:hypothetical protein